MQVPINPEQLNLSTHSGTKGPAYLYLVSGEKEKLSSYHCTPLRWQLATCSLLTHTSLWSPR